MFDTLAFLPAIPVAVWIAGGVASIFGVTLLSRGSKVAGSIDSIVNSVGKVIILGAGAYIVYRKYRK